MSTVILCCETLEDYVDAAQKACGTGYDVILLDREYHAEPKDMKNYIVSVLNGLPDEADTVLFAMGLCGGSLDGITCKKRTVIPRVDDCVTLVMTTSDEFKASTKEPGHMYLFGDGLNGFSIRSIYEKLLSDYDEETAQIVFDMYFENYRYLDVIETGIYDSRAPEFTASAREDAERIGAELGYVPGGNLLLEKLVSGRWDGQFVVKEPGEIIKQDDFV